MWGMSMTGGSVTFTELGKRFVKKGHRVTITVFDEGFGVMTNKGIKPNWEQDTPIEYIPISLGGYYRRAFFDLSSRLLNPRAWAFQWEMINKIIDYIPDCDVNVATYFPSAFAVYMSKKGKAQFYHMQHYEPLFLNTTPHNVEGTSPVKTMVLRAVNKLAPEYLAEISGQRLAELSYVVPLNRIANCSWLQKTVKEKHGVESTVINHAIRDDVFYPRHVERSSNGTILCLGKTHMFWKGNSILAEALKIVRKQLTFRLMDIELILYGSDTHPVLDFPYKYVYKPSFDELAKLYCSAHMVICPSWYESFPAPPLEGMACGVPVVTTSIGVEDYARDGENCLVVPPRNPQAMADAILRLLVDKNLCHRLSEGGFATAQNFSWDKTANSIEGLFKQVLDANWSLPILRNAIT
jgi:glycosyltransferase involved in cell wall biosynthesis